MKNLIRFLKHLAAARWQIRQHLPKRSMNAIEGAIRSSEARHMGELRFVVEAGLDWSELFAGITSRERALDEIPGRISSDSARSTRKGHLGKRVTPLARRPIGFQGGRVFRIIDHR